MELAHFVDVYLGFFYLAANKLIIYKTKTFFV